MIWCQAGEILNSEPSVSGVCLGDFFFPFHWTCFWFSGFSSSTSLLWSSFCTCSEGGLEEARRRHKGFDGGIFAQTWKLFVWLSYTTWYVLFNRGAIIASKFDESCILLLDCVLSYCGSKLSFLSDISPWIWVAYAWRLGSVDSLESGPEVDNTDLFNLIQTGDDKIQVSVCI